MLPEILEVKMIEKSVVKLKNYIRRGHVYLVIIFICLFFILVYFLYFQR
jgi:hypothetical protein